MNVLHWICNATGISYLASNIRVPKSILSKIETSIESCSTCQKHFGERDWRACGGLERWYVGFQVQHVFCLSMRVERSAFGKESQSPAECVSKLESALRTLCKRHKILKSCIDFPNHPPCNLNPVFVEIEGFNTLPLPVQVRIETKEKTCNVEQLMASSIDTPFETTSWLWRLHVIFHNDDNQDVTLLASFHHVNCDGLGGIQFLEQLVDELSSTIVHTECGEFPCRVEEVNDLRPSLGMIASTFLPPKKEPSRAYVGDRNLKVRERLSTAAPVFESISLQADSHLKTAMSVRRHGDKSYPTIHYLLLAALSVAFAELHNTKEKRQDNQPTVVSASYPFSLRTPKCSKQLGTMVSSIHGEVEINFTECLEEVARKWQSHARESRATSMEKVGLIGLLQSQQEIVNAQVKMQQGMLNGRDASILLSNLGSSPKLDNTSFVKDVHFMFNPSSPGQSLLGFSCFTFRGSLKLGVGYSLELATIDEATRVLKRAIQLLQV